MKNVMLSIATALLLLVGVAACNPDGGMLTEEQVTSKVDEMTAARINEIDSISAITCPEQQEGLVQSLVDSLVAAAQPEEDEGK